ncbi:MAG: type II toxin-antitoxin system VapC family toxin [Brevundimonas sp.]|uniref:type II toxin-antitoxin system VapC family toxin n=1 Tax=Brevundimonas sp. TaxID=1871086 RepID=UPI00272016BF|nr:type II toxin-antitoxin system VapC family toxin [Brevundimonas sp.]MDO9076177.1 type II toxin-antitoxin system VapC family toxin [Brevundimonas sp.]MDP3081949.1 type II toxin-antitoxin system VapC family toxin [Brevundimonas sp.]MDZ4062618.1 type II toxin-antitoxin system VapC family toxin [Brevundimonas sp.]
MFLLDTNAISEPKRARPDAGVIAWLSNQLLSDLHLSVITVGELRRGIVRLEPSRRRDDLDFWLEDLILRYGERILPVDLEVTERWASMAEANRASGRGSEMTDELIAATAHVHGLTIVTRNVRHFEYSGCRVLSPWGG